MGWAAGTVAGLCAESSGWWGEVCLDFESGYELMTSHGLASSDWIGYSGYGYHCGTLRGPCVDRRFSRVVRHLYSNT